MVVTVRRSAGWAGPYPVGSWDAAVGKWCWITPSVWARTCAVRYSDDGSWVELDYDRLENPDGSPFVGIQGRLF